MNDAPAEQPVAAARRKPTRAQRAVAFTFLAAFGATMVTVVLTGLWVQSPSARRSAEAPVVTLAAGEPHTTRLSVAASTAVDGAELTVDLPEGVELLEHPGERRVVRRVELVAGPNALPLTLVARGGEGGQLAARLRYAGEVKTFVVDVRVAAR